MVTRTRRCTYSRAGCLAPTFCMRPVKGGAGLVFRDVVATLLHRLGMVGAIVIASALIFGAVAARVIVHRLVTTPSPSREPDQGDVAGERRSTGDQDSESSRASNDKVDLR